MANPKTPVVVAPFWKSRGSVDLPGEGVFLVNNRLVIEKITLEADTPFQLIKNQPEDKPDDAFFGLLGARLVNYFDTPLYIGATQELVAGAGSDFVPPATLVASTGVLWPGQYNFDAAPLGEIWLLSETAGDVTWVHW